MTPEQLCYIREVQLHGADKGLSVFIGVECPPPRAIEEEPADPETGPKFRLEWGPLGVPFRTQILFRRRSALSGNGVSKTPTPAVYIYCAPNYGTPFISRVIKGPKLRDHVRRFLQYHRARFWP